MKRPVSIYFSFLFTFISIIYLISNTGCANIIPPGGGPKDSLPPVLLNALPKDSATHFKGNRITLTFDEYVDIQNAFENVVVSPMPKNLPVINYNFRTISIRLKDTLEPNTTYSINFGNAVRDINEGNVSQNFTYVFSTGDSIDSHTISGKVVMAETGRVDSALIAVLYRNLEDSAVAKEKPRYITKLDGKGNFQFKYLPEGTFALYVIPNEYSKYYDDTTKPFAFSDAPISTIANKPVTLYAYQLPVNDSITALKKTVSLKENKEDKKKALQMSNNFEAGKLDILGNLILAFDHKIPFYDSSKIILTDTFYKPLSQYKIVRDSNNRFNLFYAWLPNTQYRLLIDSTAFIDSFGNNLTRNDTIRFATKRTEDYGSIRLRFTNLDVAKNPVLLIVQNDKLIEASPLTQREWKRKLFRPGEYDLRILYDRNKNGIWDAGKFFGQHIQPEIVVPLETKLSVRSNWDNEKDITLKQPE